MWQALVVLTVAVAFTANAFQTAGNVASACTGALTATVTFETSCSTIDVTNAACWTPHAPGASDVVLFPAGTAAAMPFKQSYTPISAASVVVATGASVTLYGGAIAVTSCLQVQGTLTLSQLIVDNGTGSTIAFAPDPSVPSGTDCPTVPQGFSPRICGPGQAYITGTLTLSGLYASLWAQTTIAAGATVSLNNEAFVWGNVTNAGTITANHMVYFHGALTIESTGSASFTQIRPDLWTKTPGTHDVTLTIINLGTLSVNDPNKVAQYGSSYEFAATKDLTKNYNIESYVTLQIVNHGSFNINGPARSTYGKDVTFFLSSVNLNNYGTTTWTGYQVFNGWGTAINYGTFVANVAQVGYGQYVSHGGTEQTSNGGSFNFGMSAERVEAIKSRGIKGPFQTSTTLINSRIQGHVIVNEPINVIGTLTVSHDATIENHMDYDTTLQTEKSTGTVELHGRYIVGKKERLGHATLHVSRTGIMRVPEGHTVTLPHSANLKVDASAVIDVEGTIRTVKSTSSSNNLKISELAFLSGEGEIAGDFAIDAVKL